jgi:hypothetical protein
VSQTVKMPKKATVTLSQSPKAVSKNDTIGLKRPVIGLISVGLLPRLAETGKTERFTLVWK